MKGTLPITLTLGKICKQIATSDMHGLSSPCDQHHSASDMDWDDFWN